MFARMFVVVAVLASFTSALIADDSSGIQVSGQGLVRVAPDQVVIELTVTTTDDDLIRVRESSDKDARAILALAKNNGIDDNGFEVSRLELTLDYNEQLRRQIYEVQRDVTLTLGDLTKLDAMLSDLLEERNLQVIGINFSVSDVRTHKFEALKRAVTDAKEKGTHLAQLSGFKLGKVNQIRVMSEAQMPFITSITPIVGSARPRGNRRDSNPFAAANEPTRAVRLVAHQAPANAQNDAEEFALGMIEITAEVYIDFELAE